MNRRRVDVWIVALSALAFVTPLAVSTRIPGNLFFAPKEVVVSLGIVWLALAIALSALRRWAGGHVYRSVKLYSPLLLPLLALLAWSAATCIGPTASSPGCRAGPRVGSGPGPDPAARRWPQETRKATRRVVLAGGKPHRR